MKKIVYLIFFFSIGLFAQTPEESFNKANDAYQRGDYKNAIENFNLSLKLTEDDYFSDDCYYFNAYCGYYMKDYEFSKEMIDKLINKYPDSAYYNEAKNLLKFIENAA